MATTLRPRDILSDLCLDLDSAMARLEEMIDADAPGGELVKEIAALVTQAQEATSELCTVNGVNYGD